MTKFAVGVREDSLGKTNTTSYAAFAVCAPGLEQTVLHELSELCPTLSSPKIRGGGVEFRVTIDGLWRVIHSSRLIEGLRVRVGSFTATHWTALADGMKRLPVHAYLPRHERPQVRVTSKKSKLYHSDAVRERVEAALGVVGEVGENPPQVWVRIVRDKVTVSVDAAGANFYRRGYRTHIGKAPLRETLAAAIVYMGLHTPPEVAPVTALWDPFCGSGTVPIEAALMARGGWVREADAQLAFTRWPSHSVEQYEAWQQTAEPPPSGTALTVYGSDHAPKEVEAARSNAERAGVSGDTTQFFEGDVAEAVTSIPQGAAIVTNAPYGLRVGGPLDAAFGRFGAVLKSRPDLGPVTVLAGYERFEAMTKLKWQRIAEFDNRGVKVRVLRRERMTEAG